MNFVAFSVVSDQKWRLRIVQPALQTPGKIYFTTWKAAYVSRKQAAKMVS